jgi:hypothetical protein
MKNNQEIQPSKHGGARPGAGRKAGKVSQAKRELAEMAKEHAAAALRTLVEISESGESESARVSASIAILDRGYGKPPQALQHVAGDGETPMITRIELVPLTADGL